MFEWRRTAGTYSCKGSYQGDNSLNLEGRDWKGNAVSGATDSITVTYSGSTPYPVGSVFINEWMAINSSTIHNPVDGQFDDWFELYNAGACAFDLSGYYLGDHLTSTQNHPWWLIPDGTILPPNGFLFVWADGGNSPSGEYPDLHASFKLDGDGEDIYLFTPSGVQVDHIHFLGQSADVSEGRLVDGGGTIGAMTAGSTPRFPNRTPGP